MSGSPTVFLSCFGLFADPETESGRNRRDTATTRADTVQDEPSHDADAELRRQVGPGDHPARLR